jgi:type II secretory pathway pseudopilin PulG
MFGIDTAFYVMMIASLVATAASTAYSMNQQQQAAKQAEYNAEAQAEAIAMEQRRKAEETAENIRRQASEDKRFRAAQLAEISGMGIVPTVGTPLDLLADTAVKQQRNLADLDYGNAVNQWQLGAERQSVLATGRAEARNYRSQAGATLLAGIAKTTGSVASMGA